MQALEIYQEWLRESFFDSQTKAELRLLAADEAEIEDRFYKDLDFGTGGMRGRMGAGTNRINVYTVRKATQGLANDICLKKEESKGVVIAFDSRKNSDLFAREAAGVLAANGIRAYLFPSLRPTPLLSFAVRYLQAAAGIVITASHNPPAYNGYKVYGSDGAQITAPRDREIIEQVRAVRSQAEVKWLDETTARESGLLRDVPAEVDEAYYAAVKALLLDPVMVNDNADKLTIVYSPLHGAGYQPVLRLLADLGFVDLHVVREQAEPDGDFPTVDSPNPEDGRAFALALELAGQVKADVVLATDPDADRLGVYAPEMLADREAAAQPEPTYRRFTGNMSAVLVLDYILRKRSEQQRLPENGAVLTTIVSGKMGAVMAADYRLPVFESLTGFKYIGEKIHRFEENGLYEYVFGFEESNGCLIGTYARDKDAVSAVMAVCEVALEAKLAGHSLCQRMDALFEHYGYYKEDLLSVTLEGQKGATLIRQLLEEIRRQIPMLIGGLRVLEFRDYSVDRCQDMLSGQCTPTGLPTSDVLYFRLEQGAWCCVRPSGTEPKIKFYLGVKGNSGEEAEQSLKSLREGVEAWLPNA